MSSILILPEWGRMENFLLQSFSVKEHGTQHCFSIFLSIIRKKLMFGSYFYGVSAIFLEAITTSADLRKLDFSTKRSFIELSFSNNGIQSMTIKARGVLLCSISRPIFYMKTVFKWNRKVFSVTPPQLCDPSALDSLTRTFFHINTFTLLTHPVLYQRKSDLDLKSNI